MPDCLICCTEGVKHFARCSKCDQVFCRACIARYVQDLRSDVACMDPACEHPWDRFFLSGVMTKAWMRVQYRDHKEVVAWERERPRVPLEMKRVESMRAVDEYMAMIRQLGKRDYSIVEIDTIILQNLVHQEKRFQEDQRDNRPLPFVSCRAIVEATTPEDRKARISDPPVHEHYLRLHYGRRAAATGATATGATSEQPPPEPEENFTSRGHCPRPNCSGLVGKGWKCVACGCHVCLRCLVEKEELHACKKEDLESVAQIRKDSKPCPNCRVRVFRIHGCSQMFCTNCNSGFCWNTGRLLDTNRYFHNPHFLAVGRQENNRVGCDGGMGFNVSTIKNRAQASQEWDPLKWVAIRNIYSAARHAATARGRGGPEVAQVNHERNLRKLRIDLLTGECDEKTFKCKVQRLYKKRDKAIEERQVDEMFSTVLAEVIAAFQAGEMSFAALFDRCVEVYAYAFRSKVTLFEQYSTVLAHPYGIELFCNVRTAMGKPEMDREEFLTHGLREGSDHQEAA